MDRILSIMALVIAIGAGALGFVMIDRQRGDIAAANQKIDQLTKTLADTQKTLNDLNRDVGPLIAMIKQQTAQQPEAPKLDMAKLTAEANQRYLDDFAKQDRVVKLPDGVMYKVDKDGAAGGKKPSANGTVMVNYHVEFVDGTVLDDSGSAPAQIPIGSVIPGWQEILPMMKEGDSWTVVIPAKFAYGEAGRGPVPPGQVLVFKIELVKVVS